MMKTQIVQSHKYCQSVVKRRAKSFYSALRFLPSKKRQGLYALYAFARLADDIVDGHVMHMDLDMLRANLDCVFSSPQHVDGNDFTAALAETVFKYELPRHLFDDLIAGMEMDQLPIHFKVWEETKDYCYKAASTVGLLCVEVFEYDDPNARIYANELGIAMQLTNILRDLKEDFERGRQYLPQEDFEAFNLTYEELVTGQKPLEAAKFVRFQADRAMVHYERANKLFPMVHKNARYCPRALSMIYQKVLEEIQKNPTGAIKQKVSLSTSTKLVIVFKAMWGK